MEKWKKRVTLFLTSQSISLLGSMMVMYAIMWYIALDSDSGLMMTIMVLCTFIPSLILTPFAGVWADRLNRKALMIVADLAIALVTLVIAILFFFGIKDIWIIFIVSVGRSIGQAIHQPAVSAVYPQIVPEDKLLKVQGINQGIQSASMVGLPLLAGFLLSQISIEFIFLIDVITAAIAVWMLIFIIKLPKHKAEEEKKEIHYIKDIKDGLVYAKNHKFVLSILVFGFLFVFLMAAPAFLTYIQVGRVFGGELWRLTYLEAFFGVGMVLGSITISLWGGFKNRLKTFFISYLLIGAGGIGLGLPYDFWIYIIVWGIMGFFMSLSSPILVTLVQEKVEPEYIGRVFSVYGLIQTASMPLGMLIFGPLADQMDISHVILITGIFMVILSFIPLFMKNLMKEGLRAPKIENKEMMTAESTLVK